MEPDILVATRTEYLSHAYETVRNCLTSLACAVMEHEDVLYTDLFLERFTWLSEAIFAMNRHIECSCAREHVINTLDRFAKELSAVPFECERVRTSIKIVNSLEERDAMELLWGK